MATVAQLGARVLRRLGFSLVPQTGRLSSAAPVTAETVAAMVLRDRGIPVAEADRPAALPPVSQDTVARAALRQLGVGQATSEAQDMVPQSEIAARALRLVNVNPAATLITPSGAIYARTDIARRILLKLDVIASDATPIASDQGDVVAALSSIHDDLAGRGIVNWPADAVPEHAVEQYVTMGCNVVGPQFGRPASLDAWVAAETMLRQQALQGTNAATRAITAVAAVHAELAGDGLIDWTASAIPAAAADHYATMVGQLIGPVYGAARDMAAYDAAMAKVRRVALSGSLGLSVARDKVGAVHDALNAMGVVSWPVSAIPQAYAEDYAAMAATRVAAFAGLSRDPQSRQADEEAWTAAAGHVKRGAMIAGMQERALAKVRAVQSELQDAGIASWDGEHIPASMADAYAAAATALMGAEDGTPGDPFPAYKRIRMLAMNGPAGQALAEQKIRAVHFSLEARGRTRWSLASIPLFAEEPYVVMASALLAPELDMPSDAAGAIGAERDLMRIVSLPSAGARLQVEYF